jgi:hypothetical protein
VEPLSVVRRGKKTGTEPKSTGSPANIVLKFIAALAANLRKEFKMTDQPWDKEPWEKVKSEEYFRQVMLTMGNCAVEAGKKRNRY